MFVLLLNEGIVMQKKMSKSIIPQFPNRKRRICMLMITHACNLNCTYCYERFKDNSMMSFETAQKCILKEIDFVKNSIAIP